MNIIFFGTSEFAVPSLEMLSRSPHKIALVVTQPDAKKGRRLKITPPAIKEAAAGLGLAVFQSGCVSSAESIERLKAQAADLFVVVSFGQILKKTVLDLPDKFSINLHASLLPAYRGAAPINWAVINGETKTGITVFKLVEKMDAGDIILDKEAVIEESDNALTLGRKLSQIGAKALLEAVNLIDSKKAVFRKQDETLISPAPKLKKSDGLIDWSLSAARIHNMVRGLLPWPSAFTGFSGKQIKILETSVAAVKEEAGPAGRIISADQEAGILVKAGSGCLAIKRLQPEGSKPMGFEEFLRGHKLPPGGVFS